MPQESRRSQELSSTSGHQDPQASWTRPCVSLCRTQTGSRIQVRRALQSRQTATDRAFGGEPQNLAKLTGSTSLLFSSADWWKKLNREVEAQRQVPRAVHLPCQWRVPCKLNQNDDASRTKSIFRPSLIVVHDPIPRRTLSSTRAVSWLSSLALPGITSSSAMITRLYICLPLNLPLSCIITSRCNSFNCRNQWFKIRSSSRMNLASKMMTRKGCQQHLTCGLSNKKTKWTGSRRDLVPY